MDMKQIENYTGLNFDDDLFHYCGDNNYFVRATLLPNSAEFSRENNRMYSSIKVTESLAIEKLGKSNFISEWDTNYWIYEFNGDLFYYQNDMRKGSTIGIFCKKKDKTKNWLFEPVEYEYQESEELGLKMLAFCKVLSDKLHK